MTRPSGGRQAVGAGDRAPRVRGDRTDVSVFAGMPSTDIGQLFRDLRRCLRQSLPDLARRLETRIDVIEALEGGDVRRLPAWPETVRIVSAYTLLAGIDPRPVLHVISERITAEAALGAAPSPRPGSYEAPISSRRAAPAPGGSRGIMAVAGPSLATLRPWIGLLRPAALPGTPVLRWVMVGAVLITLSLALLPSPMLQASATSSTLATMFGGLTKYMHFNRNAERGGMIWIDADDPRARKSDKLRSAKP